MIKFKGMDKHKSRGHGYPLLALLGVAVFFQACAPRMGQRPGFNRHTGRGVTTPVEVKSGSQLTGEISYYGKGFHGKKTANGETFNQHQMTAAHKTLPFDTRIKVTLLSTGKSVVVRVNDRGPFVKNRILDVSYGAAKKLGLIEHGTGSATLKVL